VAPIRVRARLGGTLRVADEGAHGMTGFGDRSLQEQVAQWRAYLRRRRASSGPDVDTLEAHLRQQMAALIETGLAADEAFLVALKRIGASDGLSHEFARAYSERLWKPPAGWPGARPRARREMLVVVALAVAAALAVKAPALFGLELSGGHERFYARNASLFVLPLLAAYFLWKRGLKLKDSLRLAPLFASGAVFANAYPFRPGSDTEVLSALHLPIALWLAVGLAYTGCRWFGDGGRMNFVRFSGELAIYYALIALGGVVLTGVTVMLFHSIGMNPKWFVEDWLIPCGAAGAVVIASWLVESKQGLVENIAPVLTRLFTPLLAAVLLVFLAAMAWTGSPVRLEREVLIRFDLLLALVVGLVLYAASARNPEAPPGLFDALQLVLVASALVADGVALAAIAARISGFGFTANRVAALGENLVLLVNLAWSAWLYARLLRRRGSFADLERWQIAYLPVYSVWAALVVILFPPVFGFR
jgi:hypothetical protein